MIQKFIDFITGFFSLMKIPIIIVAVAFAYFALVVLINVFIFNKQGIKSKGAGIHRKPKKRPLLVRLLWDFPRMYTYDLLNTEPDYFKYQGLIVFTGRQGMGKTISLVQFMRDMQVEFPKAKCLTNLAYTKEDISLDSWEPIVNFKNEHLGVIIGMDELQNWFSSNQSKNFPPEMMEVVTQNRKNRRVILGTAQNFYLLAKALRTQTVEVRECFTLLGCITFVRKREPVLDAEGNVVEWKNRGTYFYVHDKELRECYDTYRVIESLAKSGFKEQIVPANS